MKKKPDNRPEPPSSLGHWRSAQSLPSSSRSQSHIKEQTNNPKAHHHPPPHGPLAWSFTLTSVTTQGSETKDQARKGNDDEEEWKGWRAWVPFLLVAHSVPPVLYPRPRWRSVTEMSLWDCYAAENRPSTRDKGTGMKWMAIKEVTPKGLMITTYGHSLHSLAQRILPYTTTRNEWNGIFLLT